ncbi:peptidoglycan DD-metalloendopeptidase family protein [Patescibacteria group bacterium]|nr:peptidoglycan DD-metalloendopeptidase family protein [Patescibacteria group bacterium]
MILSRNLPFRLALAACVLIIAIIVYSHQAFAQTAGDLQQKIDQRNQDIADLEKQIRSYQSQIDSLGSQATSLSSAIKSLDLNRKQLETKIKLTEDQIANKTAQIEQLGGQIDETQGSIDDDRRIVFQTFLVLNETSDKSLIEILLGSDSLATALDSLDRLGVLEQDVYGRIHSLSKDKSDLVLSQQASMAAKADLMALDKQLGDQRSIVLDTVAEKNSLLAETKQSQTAYMKMLASKKAQESALQDEISQYEQQLHLLVNPNQIPPPGHILSWPLDHIRITQYFGNTPFSTANPQLYSGKGHDGIDLAAAIGTPVKAALSGTVIGVENTDLFPGCYSFGKWVMIKHADGLSTLYGHLSLQLVSVGQEVATGQLIGYSGNTGYTTGPHLHFGVYATAGTVIKLFTNSRHCQGAKIPIADWSAYLNPLSYI